MHVLGIDIGGSGIKGAPVDCETGKLLADRYRLPTPTPSKPKAIASVVRKIANSFDWHGPIGCGFPAVVRQGITLTAANVHNKWIGIDAVKLLYMTTGCSVSVINDADAAGLAEMKFGAGRGRKGVVMIITVGTGLGTALFTDGYLFPNTELGHIKIRGKDAEIHASDAARKREKLSWKKWALRFNEYAQTMEGLFWPDLIIIGGGASKKFDQFSRYLRLKTPVHPAELGNEAGIVGAALSAMR